MARRHILSNQNDRFVLMKPRSQQVCVWSGDTIERGTLALGITTQRTISSKTRTAWCSLGSVDAFASRIDEIAGGGRLPVSGDTHYLSPSEQVRLHELTSQNRRSCAVCDSLCQRRSRVVSMYQPHPSRVNNITTVRFHRDCADDFSTILDRTWEYASDFAGDII